MIEVKENKSFYSSSNRVDSWYIVRSENDHIVRYLHSDMIWRDGTSTADGWTGYYKTKEEAEKQLADYQKGMDKDGTDTKDNQSGKETEKGN